MSNDWFRSWHGAPTDNKWLVIGRKAGVSPGVVSAVVWALLDHASQVSERGSVADFDVETYAAFSGFDEDQIRAVIDALKDKGVIGPDGGFRNWSKRQPKREDNSTERSRAFREKQKQNERETNAEKHDATQCNATQREATLDKIREDKDKIYSDTNVSGEVAPADETVVQLSAADPRSELFTRGLAAVMQLTGRAAPQARTQIGHWLKLTKDEAVTVLKAVDDAVEHRPANPSAWIEAALRKNPQGKPSETEAERRRRMQAWV